MTPDLDADTYGALCIWDEAANQPYEGQAAVGQIILNRAKLHFFSDGSIENTVLAKFQFSGFWFEMEQHHYTQICHDMTDAIAQAHKLLAEAQARPATWKGIQDCWAAVKAGTFKGGPVYQKVFADPRALLYVNLAIVARPAWATPAAELGQIYAETFFRG